MTTEKYEWSYTKVAFLLDYEEVTLPTCAIVRKLDIREPAELAAAFISGEIREKTSRRKAWKEIAAVVLKHCRPNMADFQSAIAAFYQVDDIEEVTK